MSAVSATRRIGPGDRLIATLALSLLVHGVILLGVGFTREDPAPVVPTLDVILTQTRTVQPPRKADFLAQANQQGGGDKDFAQRPGEPQMADVPKPDPGIAPRPLQAQNPPPQPDAAQRLLTTTSATTNVAPPQEAQPVSELPLPTGRDLTEQSMEMARLTAELQRTQQLYAKRPRKKFFSASTQEYEYAAYMRAYVARLERVGTLNFPDEARRRNLSGSAVLTVEIRRDGSVASIDTIQSSGIPLLDQAAVQTVRLAEPFPELPHTKDDPDILNITRTFRFLPGGTVVNE
ncbi:MAG TPA: energy transducer TonB [Xanthomonadaceae bacterium]|nr:energy transducer TonB [Xanthomonadaceae bacterium]